MLRLFVISSLLAIGAVAATVVSAQSTQIEQIGSRSAPDQSMSQVSSGSRDVGVPLPARRAPSAPPSQLSSEADARPATPQLTQEVGRIRPSQQLYRGGRTAQPSEALSTVAQGRTGAVTRVSGLDRCDAALPEKDRDPACAKVIERRASEFTATEPAQLSAEQKLLAEQRMRETGNLQSAARRLANGPTGAESMDEQGIASVVLGTNTPPPAPQPAQPTAQDAENAALANAIVTAIIANPKN